MAGGIGKPDGCGEGQVEVFDAFEDALAMGLICGQVLRCEFGSARAADLGNPYRGPWIVETAAGERRELPTPLRAAKMWRMYLHIQTQIDAGKVPR